MYLIIANIILISWIIYGNRDINFSFVFIIGYAFYIFIPYLCNTFFLTEIQNNFILYQKQPYLDQSAQLISIIYLSMFGLSIFFFKNLNLEKKNFKIFNLKEKEVIFFFFSSCIFIFFLKITKFDLVIVQLVKYQIIFLCLGIVVIDNYLKKVEINRFINVKLLYFISFFIISIFFLVFVAESRKDIANIIIVYLFFFTLKYNLNLRDLSMNLTKNFFIIVFILISLYLMLTFFTFKRSDHLHEGLEYLSKSYILGYFEYITQPNYLFSLFSYYDFMPTFENFKFIIKTQDENVLYGSSIFKFIFSFIPRDLWNLKPYGAEIIIVEKFTNPFVGGTSQGTTLFGEIFWNFKIILGSIFVFIFGFIIQIIDHSLKRKNMNSNMFYLIFCFFPFEMWRGAFSNYIMINLVTFFAIILSLLLYRKLGKVLEYE